LIDACISALHLYGPSRTTVEKVVAIAKMSPGIVRFYFDSKAAMLVASLQFLSAEFEDQLLVPVSQLKSNPVAALELMVDLYLDPEIASPRKVSVWYAFWGEASSRQEYYDICGHKDEGFAVLVRELIGRLIEATGQIQLDPDGIALGLIGVLEMLWQDFAFRQEEDIDRAAAKRRCMAYLKSVFPGQFDTPPVAIRHSGGGRASIDERLAGWVYGSERAWSLERESLFRGAWQIAAHGSELTRAGDFVAADLGVERVLLMRDAFGAVQAFRNSCPHLPHALVSARRGRLEGGLECQAHGLRFAADGRCAAGGGADLASLPVRAAGGFFWARSRGPVRAGTSDADFPQTGGTGPDDPFRTDADVLRAFPDIEVSANWKLVAEQWLEAHGQGPGAGAVFDADGIDWPVSIESAPGWSAGRYRRLAGSTHGKPWLLRFAAPNQFIERRPDGLAVLQIVPISASRCHVRRFHLARADDAADALQYLAGRLIPRSRQGTLAIAESAQQGLSEFGYRTADQTASIGVAWFRKYLTSRVPELAGERAPSEPR
jgi:TetR/AcrR family transcriptional repressor of bet genes